MITFSKVNLRYVKDYYALCNVNYEFEKGKNYLLLGDSGSGRSSLLRTLAGLEKSFDGEVEIDGINVKRLDYKLDKQVGFLPQNGVFFENKSVYNNLMYALKVRNDTASDYELEQKIIDIMDKIELAPFRHEKMYKLSNFQRLLVSLARLSFRELDVLLIDDIFALLDNEEMDKFMEIYNDLFNKKTCYKLLAISNRDLIERFEDNVVVNFDAGCITKI